jgi:hypothetical protein
MIDDLRPSINIRRSKYEEENNYHFIAIIRNNVYLPRYRKLGGTLFYFYYSQISNRLYNAMERVSANTRSHGVL